MKYRKTQKHAKAVKGTRFNKDPKWRKEHSFETPIPGTSNPSTTKRTSRSPFQPGSRAPSDESYAKLDLHSPRRKTKTNEESQPSPGHMEQPPRVVHRGTTGKKARDGPETDEKETAKGEEEGEEREKERKRRGAHKQETAKTAKKQRSERHDDHMT